MPTVRLDERDDRVLITVDDVVLAEYVHRPSDAELESPRPYFSPIRTLGGEVVSLFRPHDHVWHKGIAWSLPVVGDENFWGGPTFVSGQGYVQLPNNGVQRHRAFIPQVGEAADAAEAMDASEATHAAGAASPRLTELLEWVTKAGETIFDERRTIAAAVLDDEAWLLAFETRLTNVSGRAIPIGSPTTAVARTRATAGSSGAVRGRSPAVPCSRPALRAVTSFAACARRGWGSVAAVTTAAAVHPPS